MNEGAATLMVAGRFLITPLLGFLLSIAPSGAPAAATGISGSWSGTLVSSGQPLAVRMTFSRERSEQYNGIYSSAAQAIMEYPLDSVKLTGRRIEFVLGGGGLRFSKTARNRTITGRFSGDEGKGIFVLHRTAVPKLPYSVNFDATDRDAGRASRRSA